MSDAERMLRQWAASVDRLLTLAPISAIVYETGITANGHSTPPERTAQRAAARKVAARWLARDLAEIASSEARLMDALRLAHDAHGFSNEHCTAANCPAEALLVELGDDRPDRATRRAMAGREAHRGDR